MTSYEELNARTNRGISEYEQDKTTAIADGENVEDFVKRMLTE